MRYRLVVVASAVACLFAACEGDPPAAPSELGVDASTRDVTTSDDERDGGADASADAPSDALVPPPFPDCLEALDGGGFRTWFACESIKACVYPCAACPGASSACVLLGAGANTAACMASCASCKSGTAALPDSCSGTCTDLASDGANCGTCGHRCQVTPHAGGALCSQAHCCPAIDPGDGILQPTTWAPSCGMCCVGGCADGGGRCVPEGTD